MIGLLVVDAALVFCIIILAIKLWDCSANLDRAEYRIDSRGAEIRELKQRCDAYKELIEALSKSVRELNGVVEAAVKDKEQTSDNKPDTKALMGGWTADDGRTNVDGKSVMNCELPTIQPVATDTNVGDKDGNTINRMAVELLDRFAKIFCKDDTVTDDLVFHCKQCAFEMPDGTCLVKVMAARLCPDYKDFGSMGDL